jgi:hypothetical protein
LFKRAIDIGYHLIKAQLNQENCQWLSGEIVLEKKPLRPGFESLQRLREILRLKLGFN